MSHAAISAIETVDCFTLAQARRVAAMLDIDPAGLRLGDPVPRGWHFALLAGETPRHSLRSDGFPGLGIAMPQLERPRLLLGQRRTSYQGDLAIGTPVRRQSSMPPIVEKSGRSGPLSIVTVEHDLSGDHGSVTEAQTYYLAGLPSASAVPVSKSPQAAMPEGITQIVTPDDVMLFQYSALGFNTHRIHFDRSYATQIEGHPDLVVNGGLATLLATEFIRTAHGCVLKSLTARHLAPLYVNRPLTILARNLTAAGAEISLIDCDGIVAAELMMAFDEL